MIRRTLLALAAFVAASGMARAQSDAESPRRALADALLAARMRDLGLLLARVAYESHARMLADQPVKQGVVRHYQALVEAEFGDVLRAQDFFSEAAEQLPEASPLKERARVWGEALSGRADPEKADAPLWRKRIAAAVDSGWVDPNPVVPDDPAGSLDAVLAWRRSPEAAGPLLTAAAKLRFEPQDRLRLGDLDQPGDEDVEYRLFDPGLFTALLHARVGALEERVAARDDPEARLCRVWSDLLLNRLTEAESELGGLAALPDSALRVSERSERACLGAALALIQQRPDRFAEWSSRMLGSDESDNDLPPAIPLWGLRALQLAPRQGRWRLDVARQSVRWFTEGNDPFDERLLFPQAESGLRAADELRDYYFEVAWCFRGIHREQHGTRVPEHADLPIRSAERVMTALASPLLRLPGGEWPLLRTVMQADVSCRTGNWESWQNAVSASDERREPALAALRALGRAAAAEVRLRPVQEIRHRDTEVQPDTVEVLLTGVREFSDAPSPVDAPTQHPVLEDRTAWLRGALRKLASLSAVTTVLTMAMLGWLFRPQPVIPLGSDGPEVKAAGSKRDESVSHAAERSPVPADSVSSIDSAEATP